MTSRVNTDKNDPIKGTLPGVRDADCCVHVPERGLQKLVRQNAGRVVKGEQAMIRKDRSNAHVPGMEYTFVCHRR